MSTYNLVTKRIFDMLFSGVGIVLFAPLMLACWIVASIDTRSNGLFVHRRVGRHGAIIGVYKIKTMHERGVKLSPIACENSAHISRTGVFFRRYKLDELPQLFNVFLGSMSVVGPRPDVPGYADRLQGSDRIILSLRPGITGPASIKYKDEEAILAAAADPVLYNDTVIWPDKVSVNKRYCEHYSFGADLRYIFQTLFK
jgi:lipopolysaccharide/colanic/teichoic acid biosynthesis glycosyltransferase